MTDMTVCLTDQMIMHVYVIHEANQFVYNNIIYMYDPETDNKTTPRTPKECELPIKERDEL